MALIDDVTYEYYTDTLNRSVVPDEDTFNQYSLENILYMDNLITFGLVSEKAENGFINAACMMTEVDYNQTGIDENGINKSEREKYKWINLYCDVLTGVF